MAVKKEKKKQKTKVPIIPLPHVKFFLLIENEYIFNWRM